MTDRPGFIARAAAQSVLASVLKRRSPLDAALTAAAGLSERDAGFARAIASETLRRLGQLEALLGHFLKELPPPHRAGPTFEILLAGAAELLFLETAPHAAVDGANALAQADTKARHFKPLINAVLRRIAREGKPIAASQDAERLNVPDWLWTRWAGQYGEALTRALSRAHLTQAPIDLLHKRGETGLAGGVTIFDDVVRLPAGTRVADIPGFAEDWWVQDVAATLPVRLLGDVRGQTVIDLCAAPGGKTMQLAARGASVIAVERDKERMERLSGNIARLAFEAVIVTEDLRDFAPREPAPFVLLDAPCSATGTIRRHPDLPWIKAAQDVNACASAGEELISAAARMTAPGGLLVYAVCSLEREEGREQIDGFLDRYPQFAREPVTSKELLGHEEWIEDGDLRTMPSHLAEQGGMDGFYAARLRRAL